MSTATPLRVGDSERDAAAAVLGEHYAAGRLSKAEYDERLDQVWAARYDSDLETPFADLPRRHASRQPAAGAQPGRQRMHQPHPGGQPPAWASRLMWFVPLAIIALAVVVITVGAPWLLFIALGFWVLSGCGRSRSLRDRHRHWHSHQFSQPR